MFIRVCIWIFYDKDSFPKDDFDNDSTYFWETKKVQGQNIFSIINYELDWLIENNFYYSWSWNYDRKINNFYLKNRRFKSMWHLE